MSEAEYRRLTFDLTLGWARTLSRLNPSMTFLYVSGRGTGEVSKTCWTRIGYAVLRPLPLMHAIAPGAVITTEELGRVMIRAVRQSAPKRVLENRILRALAAA